MEPLKVIKVPDTIKYPKLMDLFEKQTNKGVEASRIYPYYENLANGRWTTTKCGDCGKITFPPRVICPFCYSENLSYVDIEKQGTIFAFADAGAGVPGVLKSVAPYAVALVKFEKSGLQIAGRVYGKKSEEIKIGDTVEWGIERIEGPGPLVRYFPSYVYPGFK